MKAIVRKFVVDERGLETVEYAIILGLIVAATIGLVVSLGQWVAGQFTIVNDTLTTEAPLPTG